MASDATAAAKVARQGCDTTRTGLTEDSVFCRTVASPTSATLRQPSLKELARAVLGARQPVTRAEITQAIAQAREAAGLADYRDALTLGALHLCGDCRHFSFGPEVAGLGKCARYNVKAWPFVPFICPGFHKI
jgi:hypothetical protein